MCRTHDGINRRNDLANQASTTTKPKMFAATKQILVTLFLVSAVASVALPTPDDTCAIPCGGELSSQSGQVVSLLYFADNCCTEGQRCLNTVVSPGLGISPSHICLGA